MVAGTAITNVNRGAFIKAEDGQWALSPMFGFLTKINGPLQEPSDKVSALPAPKFYQ